ncbi:MAG: hypothetical protein PHP22_06425 [Oscillospiraceae bacterium]|nr:hypothetical protein [Oscillospiraceae bacterium]
MKKRIQKIETAVHALSFRAKQGFRNLITSEEGDTNFISIIIVLIIVVGIAGILIAFREALKEKFDEVVGGFLDGLS